MNRLTSRSGKIQSMTLVIGCGINYRKLKNLENFTYICFPIICILKVFCALIYLPIPVFSILTLRYGQNKQIKIKINTEKIL